MRQLFWKDYDAACLVDDEKSAPPNVQLPPQWPKVKVEVVDESRPKINIKKPKAVNPYKPADFAEVEAEESSEVNPNPDPDHCSYEGSWARSTHISNTVYERSCVCSNCSYVLIELPYMSGPELRLLISSYERS
jgi:hypothetical protein